MITEMISEMISEQPNCIRRSDYSLLNFAIALGAITLGLLARLPVAAAEQTATRVEKPGLFAALILAADASPARLEELKTAGANTVVFKLKSSSAEAKRDIRTAATSAEQAGLAFAYWVEVARSPQLADEHPEWMASLQTHDQWRRFFPDTPQPKSHEVAKTYPWVPILSREPFQAQRERVVTLLADLPTPKLIFLNDLQGAPSACGCGNPLCRWTSDYGKRRTTIPLGDDAAALFIKAVETVSPKSEVIPVWTTECESHDGSPDGLCAGVGCFDGICWKAYTRQLMPVAATSERIGVMATYKQFQRDIAHYGDAKASWVAFAIRTFETMPPQRGGKAIPASRTIAVLQGWNVTSEEIEAQQKAAREAGANGYVVAYDEIDQGWSPKIISWK